MKEIENVCLIVLGILVFSSCREEFEYEDNTILEETYNGNLKMPDGSPVSIETVNIISISEITTPDQDGNFKIQALENFYSYFYAEDANGSTIGMSYQDPSIGIIINDTSTAVALIMIFPIEWGQFGLTPAALRDDIMKSPKFPILVSYVHNLMINEPGELINYEKHPTILNTAAELILEIANEHREIQTSVSSPAVGIVPDQKSEQAIIGGGPSIKDIGGDPKIEILNPTGTPYGIASFNLDNDPKNTDSYGLLKIPLYVDSWSLNWWIIPKKSKTEFNLGDGSWVVMLSRVDPWYLSAIGGAFVLNDFVVLRDAVEKGDYLEVLRANARSKAAFGTMINVLARSLGIASVFDPTEATGFTKLALEEGPKAIDLIVDIKLGGSEFFDRSAEQLIKWILKAIKYNIDKFISWSSKNGIELNAKYLKLGIENLTWVMDVVSASGDVVQLLSLAVDSYAAEQDIVYTINQSNGNATIMESRSPDEPTITGENNCYINRTYLYRVLSSDPEQDMIKYYINYGDGTSDESPQVQSGTSYTFQHVWTIGTYEIYACAVDENGATSIMVTPFKVTATPEGDFIETFENYSLGGLLDNEIWHIANEEPSKVMISNVSYDGNRAAKFVDYDPAIGEEEAKFASLYTNLDKNIQSFETFFRFDHELDAFGIRAWEVVGDFSSMAYYVIIDAGMLKWVKEGNDHTNPADFITITSVSPRRWYNLRLLVNWDNATYDIYLDNILVKSDAEFVATARGNTIFQAPELQFVAFTDASCRSFYIDDIYIKGAHASNLDYYGTKSDNNGLYIKSFNMVDH